MDDEAEREQSDFADAILGLPPSDFRAKVELAQEITKYLHRWELDYSKDIDEDALIIAAFAQYLGPELGRNPLGFTLRVKQIVDWLRADSKETEARINRVDEARDARLDQELLENKTKEIARQVGRRLYKDEAFLLLVFGVDKGPAWVSHASSIDRAQQIELLEKHLRYLRAAQTDA